MAHSNNNQENSLEPGHRFCPNDKDLICYYLKGMVDTGELNSNVRFHKVNIYDYGPDELTG